MSAIFFKYLNSNAWKSWRASWTWKQFYHWNVERNVNFSPGYQHCYMVLKKNYFVHLWCRPFPFVCMLRPHLSIQNAWQQNFCRIKWFRTSNNMQHIPHFWKLWSASVSSNVISYQHWRKFQMFFFCLNTDYDFFLELQITFGALWKAVCSLCQCSLLCVLKACDMILKEKKNNKSLHRNNVTPFSFWWSMRSFDFTNENNFNVIVWKHFIIVSFFWTVNTLQHRCR